MGCVNVGILHSHEKVCAGKYIYYYVFLIKGVKGGHKIVSSEWSRF